MRDIKLNDALVSTTQVLEAMVSGGNTIISHDSRDVKTTPFNMITIDDVPKDTRKIVVIYLK